METTKNNLPPNIIHFFKKLSNYLDTKLMFFGSVQRADYLPGSSDIDVDIFTDNVKSTIIKVQHFLKVKKTKFKRFVWKLNNSQRVAYGYKIMYKNPEEKLAAEFSIYDEKFKDDILKEQLAKIDIPLYISWMLIFLKILHYNLEIISKETYKMYKKIILSYMIGLPEDNFVVLETTTDTLKGLDF